MATIDDAKIVRDLLNTDWNAGNVAKPVFYYDDTIKEHDYRKDAVKVYQRSLTRIPKGLGYTHQEIRTGISVDIRCSNRDRMLLLRDEVNRVLNSKRINPDTNYHNIFFDNERQVSGYANFWHYVIDITLKNFAKAITT